MELERAQELWTKHLAGENLSPESERELLAALESDSKLRERLLGDEQMDGALRGYGRGKSDAEAFQQSVADRLAAEKDGRRFISGVRRKVQAEVDESKSGQATSASGRSKSFRSVRRRERQTWGALPLAIAAMAALAAIGLVYNLRKPRENIAITPTVEPTPPDKNLVPSPAIAAIGRIVKISGNVVAISGGNRSAVRAGQDLVDGQAFEAGANGTATLEFKDGTQLVVKANTRVQSVSDGNEGKRIAVATGNVWASVAKQPEDKPLIIKTGIAELKVLGTKFDVEATLASTRLDVHEGKVRLARTADNAAVDVAVGQYVVAGATGELAVKSHPKTRDNFHVNNSQVESLAFSPDGKYLLAGYFDVCARLWNLTSDEPPRELRGFNERVRVVEFSRDGSLIATGSWDHTVKIWDGATLAEVKTLTCSGKVWAVSFSNDGKSLLTGDFDKKLRLWNIATGKDVLIPSSRLSEVLCATFSNDGKVFAAGGTGGNAKIYDALTLKERRELRGDMVVDSIAFSPDDSLIATGQVTGTVSLWNAATGKVRRTINAHSDEVSSVRFTIDGQILITASHDKTIKLWNVNTGELINTITAKGKVRAIDISPKGDIFASGGYDQDIHIHRLDSLKK